MQLSSSFCYTFDEQACDTLFSHHFILSINVKNSISFTGKNNFIACDACLQVLTKTSDRFETIELYRRQVSRKIDFAKYPVVINLLRHKR